MSKQLSILHVSPEVFPIVKEDNLGDVSSSLALSQKEKGQDARLMVPKYGHISERKNRIHDINRLRDMPIPVLTSEVFSTIKSSSITNNRSKTQIYVTTNDEYFNSNKGVYYNIKTNTEFENNTERFIFFSRSVVETCVLLEWFPNVIHLHNWQTALVAAFAKILYPYKFEKTKFVLTVHNFEEQGESKWENYKVLGLEDDEEIKNFKHKNRFNPLKAGLHYADYITTTSETYAKDILNEKMPSNGLISYLKLRKDEFKGILNGIDHWFWHPTKAEFLDDTLEDEDWEKFKYDNKVKIINKFNLEFHPKKVLFAISSKTIEDNGYELLIEAVEELVQREILIIIQTHPIGKYFEEVRALAEKYPDKIAVGTDNDEAIKQTLIAGADFYLSIAKYNPCDTNFMYACRYGTIPLALFSGGITEFAKEFDGEDSGNCIIMKKYDKSSLIAGVDSCIELFQNKEKLEVLFRNCLDEEFGWDESLELYDEIYRKIFK